MLGIGGATGLTAMTPALAIAMPATKNLELRRVDGEWLGDKP
jgi:hypothetical protein